MGANATTFVPSYTSGEVLTAANLSVTNSGIPVFATTVTRDAAFGGTGEKTLAEGQFAYIEATNTTQYYDGAAWQSVGVAPGLVLITTATATAVQTLSINDCFSSTYAAYEIQIINTNSVGVNSDFTARMRLSGTDTTTNYRTQRAFAYSTTTGAQVDPTGADEWWITRLDPTYKGYFANITLFNPNAAQQTVGMCQGNYFASDQDYLINNMGLVQRDTTQFTGITFITAGTSFTGTIRVYGYANS
jgi:hypothetical protein